MVDKNKAVLVEKNGQQLKYKLDDRTINATNDLEQAAALEKDSEEAVPVITGIQKSKKIIKNQKRKSNVKPVFSAIASAAIVGSLLGFFMIRMFVNVEADNAGQALNNTIPVSGTNGEAEATAVSSVELEALHAHVLQAGIFSEMANAEESAADFEAKGIPVMIWERDNQFFLLAGIGETNEQAKVMAEEMKQDHSIDIYVKEWSTNSGTQELTASEQEWISQFQGVWQESLTTWTEQHTFSKEKWAQLISSQPEETEILTPVVTAINNITEQDSSAIQLLKSMYAFEQIAQ